MFLNPLKPSPSKDGVYFNAFDSFNEVFKLTATEQISSQSNYQVSTQPTVDIVTVTDALNRQPRVVTISGVMVPDIIGGFFSLNERADTESWVEKVERVRQNKQVVSLYADDGLSLPKCFITSLEASKDKTISNGLRINIQFTEIIAMPQQIGKSTAVVKDTGTGSSNTTAKTAAKGSVTTKVQQGHLSTTDGNSMQYCKYLSSHETTYKGSNANVWDAMSSCNDARLSTATSAQKSAAESQAKDVAASWKGNGGSTSKGGK